jgi:hypothetical protein
MGHECAYPWSSCPWALVVELEDSMVALSTYLTAVLFQILTIRLFGAAIVRPLTPLPEVVFSVLLVGSVGLLPTAPGVCQALFGSKPGMFPATPSGTSLTYTLYHTWTAMSSPHGLSL